MPFSSTIRSSLHRRNFPVRFPGSSVPAGAVSYTHLHCTGRVEKAPNDLEGVTAEVSLEGKSATVTQMCIRDSIYIIQQIKDKLNLPNMKVIATGGLAKVIDENEEIFDVYAVSYTHLNGMRPQRRRCDTGRTG